MQLSVQKFLPNSKPFTPRRDNALVIFHGLFGSKSNWFTFANVMAKRLEYPVYTVDLPNHGMSPFTSTFSIPSMREDLSNFFARESLSNFSLLGHSLVSVHHGSDFIWNNTFL